MPQKQRRLVLQALARLIMHNLPVAATAVEVTHERP
jgi:hypothetical protein